MEIKAKRSEIEDLLDIIINVAMYRIHIVQIRFARDILNNSI